MRELRLLSLILLIGLPLWLYEKAFGHQPDRLVGWLDRKVTQ